MNSDTRLYRQIHPSQIQEGRVSSQAFRPMPKDEGQLSVYDGDLLSAEDAYNHFTQTLSCCSCGVLAVTVQECKNEKLSAASDPETHEYHALIDFSALTKSSEVKKASVHLRDIAVNRGWLFRKSQ